MRGYTKERAGERISELAGRGLDLVTLWQEATEILRATVPHFMSPCWFTLDPVSLLITSHYQKEILEFPPEWLAHEYYEDDFHKMADVARSERGVSTIHEATDGDPSRSVAWNLYVKPYGGDQELLVALRTQSSEPWGILGLYREPANPSSIETIWIFCAASRKPSPTVRRGRCSSARHRTPRAGGAGTRRPRRGLERGVAHSRGRALAH